MADLEEFIATSYELQDMSYLIDDIENAKEICVKQGNPEWGIPLSRLYPILVKYFPQLKKHIEDE